MPSQVSIHAPREGCDLIEVYTEVTSDRFNSRTPGGVRLLLLTLRVCSQMFQFTHPGRGATAESAHFFSS